MGPNHFGVVGQEKNWKMRLHVRDCVTLKIKKIENSLKFIYSEKATKFCEISTVDLSYVVMVKSRVEILQNFVAFSGPLHLVYHTIESRVKLLHSEKATKSLL